MLVRLHGARAGANHVFALDVHPPLCRADLIGFSSLSGNLWTVDLQGQGVVAQGHHLRRPVGTTCACDSHCAYLCCPPVEDRTAEAAAAAAVGLHSHQGPRCTIASWIVAAKSQAHAEGLPHPQAGRSAMT